MGFDDTLRDRLVRFTATSKTHRVLFLRAGPALDGALLGQRVLGNLSRVATAAPLATLARALDEYLALAVSEVEGRIAITGEALDPAIASTLQLLATHADDAEKTPSQRPTASPPSFENPSSRRMPAAPPLPPRSRGHIRALPSPPTLPRISADPPRAPRPPPPKSSASSHTKLIATRVPVHEEPAAETEPPVEAPPEAPPEIVIRSIAPEPMPEPEIAPSLPALTPEELPVVRSRSIAVPIVVILVIVGACVVAALGVLQFMQRSLARSSGEPISLSLSNDSNDEPSVVPPPAPAKAEPEVAKPSTASTIGVVSVNDPAVKGHRVIVDGRAIGDAPKRVELSCGVHSIRVGSKGALQKIDVPCGGEVSVAPRW